MMSKSLITAAMMLLSSTTVTAQNHDTLNGESEYMYDDMMQIWRNTENSSCLTIDSTRNRGYAEFNFFRREGSYHRVQEGSSMNQFAFFTERYQHIGKYLYGYGKFMFDEGSTKNRAWSDVMRTYESNPFISGSDVPGTYDHQDFDLKASVGTVDFAGWRFGLLLDYKVGDLSRLRDPRSRNRLLDYRLTPSFSYTSGRNTVGLAGYYNRRKEKMPALTTVQNNPNLYYYQMSGMETAVGSIGGYSGFQREYVNHAFGAELEYGYKGESLVSVNSVSIEKGTEYIYEQYRREPGLYSAFTYDFASQNRIVSEAAVHQIDVEAKWRQGYADEYRPQLVITTDKETGFNSYHYENLMTFKKRYQYEAIDLNLHYRLNFLSRENAGSGIESKNNSIKSYVGVEAKMRNMQQKHLLPESSFDLKTVLLNAEYGQALLKDNRLWLTLDMGYHISSKTDMKLADENTQYAQHVLLEDMNFYSANAFRGKVSVKYQFPLSVKKTRNLFYVKAFAETIQAQRSLNATNIGFALGITN